MSSTLKNSSVQAEIRADLVQSDAVRSVRAQNVPLVGAYSAVGTFAASDIVNGLITVAGTAYTLTSPTASQIQAALTGCKTGDVAELFVSTTASGTVTIAAGTGVTIVGTATILTTVSRRLVFRVGVVPIGGVGTPTVTLYM